MFLQGIGYSTVAVPYLIYLSGTVFHPPAQPVCVCVCARNDANASVYNRHLNPYFLPPGKVLPVPVGYAYCDNLLLLLLLFFVEFNFSIIIPLVSMFAYAASFVKLPRGK